jgi:hypothetical protein
LKLTQVLLIFLLLLATAAAFSVPYVACVLAVDNVPSLAGVLALASVAGILAVYDVPALASLLALAALLVLLAAFRLKTSLLWRRWHPSYYWRPASVVLPALKYCLFYLFRRP